MGDCDTCKFRKECPISEDKMSLGAMREVAELLMEIEMLSQVERIVEGRNAIRAWNDDFKVNTIRVYNAAHKYQTVIRHPDYANGKPITVQLYDKREAARLGHIKWINVLALHPPRIITEVWNVDVPFIPKGLQEFTTFKRGESREDLPDEPVHLHRYRTEPQGPAFQYTVAHKYRNN